MTDRTTDQAEPPAGDLDVVAGRPRRWASALHWAPEKLAVAMANKLRYGALDVTFPSGARHVFRGPEPGPYACLTIRDPNFYTRLVRDGQVGVAEAYMAGEIETPDLYAVMDHALKNEDAMGQMLLGHRFSRLFGLLAHLLRANSKAQAKRNIAAHYDLGNAFYEKWLDPSMTYSSAVFGDGGGDLVVAQERKNRRIAEMAGLRSGHRTLEIGCGWGGFAEFAAREVGCNVTAITISDAQYAYAAERIQRAGLNEKVEIRRQDYRDVPESYDRIVSIEMFEAVGEKYWPVFFHNLRERLVPGGVAALQVITIADRYFERYRRGSDFIQRYIFPGGMLPSPGSLRAQTQSVGLNWQRDDRFAADYALTLRIWRDRFDAAWPEISGLGFDERFRRMWRFYLAYCEAGFNHRRIDLAQLAIART